jgi:hypothetical protein
MISTFMSNFSPLRLRHFRMYLGGQEPAVYCISPNTTRLRRV